ncbi:MAG TPA: hypothetical protein PK649_01080 [Vicingus sp.]|jgi:hypothetical protein|nr:hypothetical protein [Flavobacteriales bacterium]MBV6485872.1 hypothetical protein [Flavobacteriales bacterium]HRN40648.1 hypothetical protein [Vicingus sp.]HRP59190.1 hypothetical protein [Vicingus sp.]
MFRRGIAILLAVLALFFTVMSILAVWDIINIEHIISKTLTTLLIIFVSAAVMLFIFSVLYKPDSDKNS